MANFSASCMYKSYDATLKLQWIICAACAAMAATTGGGQCPAFTTPMPPAKSIISFPSASVMMLPLALIAVDGLKMPIALGTNCFLLSSIICELLIW